MRNLNGLSVSRNRHEQPEAVTRKCQRRARSDSVARQLRPTLPARTCDHAWRIRARTRTPSCVQCDVNAANITISFRNFFCSTAPQVFFRPDRGVTTPARADAVKVGRRSALSTRATLIGRALTASSTVADFARSGRKMRIADGLSGAAEHSTAKDSYNVVCTNIVPHGPA